MATPHVPIGNVAEVLPGYAVKGRVEDQADGSHQLIQGRHLSPGQPYRYRAQDALRITPRRRVERYQVAPGDVLLASRGNVNYAVEIEAVPPQTIAPATFYILRPRSDLITDGYMPSYLAWVLRQPPVQAQITQLRTSAATPIVQREDFTRVMIPLPLLEEQRRIARLAGLMQRERALLAQLTAATDRRQEAIGMALLQGRLRPESRIPTS